MEDPISYSLQKQIIRYGTGTAFSLPTGITTGDMDYDAYSGVLWMVEDNTTLDRIVTVDPSTGLILDAYCAPDTVTRSIVVLDSYVYIADSNADKIYKIDKNLLTPYDGTCATPEK